MSQLWSLGVIDVVFGPDDPTTASRRARDLGFEHLDTGDGVDPATLALPLGCPFAPRPRPGFGASLARRTWDATVEAFRDAPGCLLEPTPGSVVGSTERVLTMLDEVPGLALLVDTGHVADWGGDPCELLAHAGHVQLRQAAPGANQLHVDDPAGVVDLAAVLEELRRLDYQGLLTVEYFDLPDFGWPLDDPVGWSVDLADRVRSLC